MTKSRDGARKRTADKTIRRASIACKACRTRRMRCDGDSKRNAACTNCTAAGESCRFTSHDGRKKSRVNVAELQERIAALEREGRSNGLSNTVEKNILSGPGPAPIGRTLPTCASAAFEGSKEQSPSASKLESESNNVAVPQPTCMSLASSSLFLDNRQQLGCYGYTSNIPLVPSIRVALSESAQQRADLDIYAAEQLADSMDLQVHLIHLYFTYQDPAIPIVPKGIFMGDWARGRRTHYFCKFLLYSMLARSARMSDWADVRNAMSVYQRRARACILDELDDPVVATIQGLCIYGQFLTSLGNESACWLYPGLAFRLAFDMGLHRTCSNLAWDGQLTERDEQARASTMWACYILDKHYAICQGRPSAIRLEDIYLPYPSCQSVGTRHRSLAPLVELSTILDKVSAIVNKPDLLEDETRLRQLAGIADELLSWMQRLPAEYRGDDSKFLSPGPYALRLHALTAMILIHRPFAGYQTAKSEHFDEQQHVAHLPGYTNGSSRTICIQNSMQVANMLDTFRQKYGITKIFSMGTWFAQTAGMSLLLEWHYPPLPGKDPYQVRQAINMCADVLRDLGPSFPLAQKHRKVMLSLAEDSGNRIPWPIRDVPQPLVLNQPESSVDLPVLTHAAAHCDSVDNILTTCVSGLTTDLPQYPHLTDADHALENAADFDMSTWTVPDYDEGSWKIDLDLL